MSIHNPMSGLIFHSGDGRPMAMDKVEQKVIRPAIEAIGLPWYGWDGFRLRDASNLYAPGADGAGSDAKDASDLGGVAQSPAKVQQPFAV